MRQMHEMLCTARNCTARIVFDILRQSVCRMHVMRRACGGNWQAGLRFALGMGRGQRSARSGAKPKAEAEARRPAARWARAKLGDRAQTRPKVSRPIFVSVGVAYCDDVSILTLCSRRRMRRAPSTGRHASAGRAQAAVSMRIDLSGRLVVHRAVNHQDDCGDDARHVYPHD